MAAIAARPMISGSTATYPNVLPGVDLRLKAIATGYTEVLIVHDAAAAADPGLRKLTFLVHSGTGARVKPESGGALDVADAASGSSIFTAGSALMWDSSTAN